MANPTVAPWKSVNAQRKDPLMQERAIKTLDRQVQLMNDAVIVDLTTFNTEITNITNGTTTVAAKWSAYTGAMWLSWMWLNG